MDFESHSSILTAVHQMLQSQSTIMRNRTLIQKLFNGEAPNTDEECRAQNLKNNCNFLEATRIASNASNQINNSFFKGDKYFSVRLDKGPIRMRQQWSTEITNCINKELKKSRLYKSARESAHAQVVLHGPGPVVWRNRRTPIPSTAGVDDVLVPSGTLASMENLDYLSIYREMTWHQIFEATEGKAVDPGWNKPYVKALKNTLYRTGLRPVYQGSRWMFPEKMAEDAKEGAVSSSSALPKVLAWDFFYRNEDTGKWNRKMILDWDSMVATDDSKFKEHDEVVRNNDFLYEKDDYAEDWSELIHWYVGNCSNVAPYRYYSIRSIGYLLYGVCNIQNKLRNRQLDHLFQSLLTWFRNVSDDHREKLGMIDLQNFGVLPDGLSMVDAKERHTVDWNLMAMSLNQNRQLMAESSSSFLPDLQNQFSGKEMTATETLVRQNTSITLTSAVLNQLAEQSEYEYREICRRFCIKGNPDPMVKRFREKIQKYGIPTDMLDIDAWEVLPEQTVGGGNKASELTVTQALMQEFFPMADPEGQRIIGRRRYLALTDNPDEAMAVIPDAPKIPDEVQHAQIGFSVLMEGVPYMVQEGVNHLAYTGALLAITNIVFEQTKGIIQNPSGIGIAADKLAGLFNIANHLGEQIQVIAKDERRKEQAKALAKALAELIAGLQEMAKQLMALEEEQSQSGGINPETMAKIQERMMLAQSQAEIEKSKAALKQSHKDEGFAADQQRKNAQTVAEIERKRALTVTDVQAKLITASNAPSKSE